MCDWEQVENEYRAGQIPVNEIARQAGVTPSAVRHRAKRYGWERDLSEQVRAATRAKLLSDVTPAVTPHRTGAIVDAAADRGADVVRLHRRDLADLRGREQTLMAKFDALVETVATVKDLAIVAGVLTDAAQVLGKRIPLERQAFSLDEPERLQVEVANKPDLSRLTDDELDALSEILGGADTAGDPPGAG